MTDLQKKIYVSESYAKKNLASRWGDENLKREVRLFLNNDIPAVFEKEPHAVSAMQLATPNFYLDRFVAKADNLSLKPLVFEYSEDLFITTNFDKASLARLVFYNNDRNTVKRMSLINLFGEEEKRKIGDIHTLSGEGLIRSHHSLVQKTHPNLDTVDASKWYKSHGGRPKEYYKYLFSIFICYGVLMENFLFNNREREFTESIVIPAIEDVKKYFGLEPLIVPVVEGGEEENVYWWGYDESLIKEFEIYAK